MSPFVVLGEFHPLLTPARTRAQRRKKAEEIGRALCYRTEHQVGLQPLPLGNHRLHKGPWKDAERHADVMCTTYPHSADGGWHTDGCDTNADMDCALVLWASTHPTLFRWGTSTDVYSARPFQIILVRNISHKRPPGAPKRRWTFRQRVMIPAWLS